MEEKEISDGLKELLGYRSLGGFRANRNFQPIHSGKHNPIFTKNYADKRQVRFQANIRRKMLKAISAKKII